MNCPKDGMPLEPVEDNGKPFCLPGLGYDWRCPECGLHFFDDQLSPAYLKRRDKRRMKKLQILKAEL